MLEHNYNRQEWLMLDSQEKALCIAFSRLKHLVEGHQQDALSSWMRRQQRQQQQRQRR